MKEIKLSDQEIQIIYNSLLESSKFKMGEEHNKFERIARKIKKK